MSPASKDSRTSTVKLFTPYQANRALPLVRNIVADILEKARELRGKTALSSNPERDTELEDLKQEVVSLMEELEGLGCGFKDWNFETGLVDFPARIHGNDVFLCWRSDEPSVTHYHTADGGYAGRMPIPRELLEDEEPSEN
jgi:hypothetical protein